jgi:hypothetical protein
MEQPRAFDTGQHIVHLDPATSRPVSPYSPEGEIQMFGDLAIGLSRRKLSRPMALALVVLVLLPLLVSVVSLFTSW